MGKNWVELEVFVVKVNAEMWVVEQKMPSTLCPSVGKIWPALRTTYGGVPTNNMAFVEIAPDGTVKIQPLSQLDGNGCVRGIFTYFVQSQ